MDIAFLYLVTRVSTIVVSLLALAAARKIVHVRVAVITTYIVSILYVWRAIAATTPWNMGIAVSWVILMCVILGLYVNKR